MAHNNKFSLDRLGLMFKYNFATYGRSYLTYLGAALGLMLFFFILNIFSGIVRESFFATMFYIFLGFSGIAIPGISFRELRSKTLATSYLTLPASASEKFFSSFIITLFGGFFGLIITFLLFNSIAIGIGALFHIKVSFYHFWMWTTLKKSLITYIFLHAIFFFGASAYKKSPIFQSILWNTLVIMSIVIIWGIISTSLFKGLNDTFHYNILSINAYTNNIENNIHLLNNIIGTIIIILLWLASYFKIKEKEVI